MRRIVHKKHSVLNTHLWVSQSEQQNEPPTKCSMHKCTNKRRAPVDLFLEIDGKKCAIGRAQSLWKSSKNVDKDKQKKNSSKSNKKCTNRTFGI